MIDGDFEVWLTVKGRENGKPYARRHPLGVPVDLARGHYEFLSDLTVREFIKDMQAEMQRRKNQQPAVLTDGWNPDQARRIG